MKTGSRAKRAPISSSTSTIRSTGGRGARRRWRRPSEPDKPILLSVGYAACHWCHVMAHESFEDDATARVMNELFVNIKVDREERPDIDQIYMAALHHLGEQGGWPLTMFLTPDGEPIWGGTYFPQDVALRQAGFRRRAARDRAAVPRGAAEDRAEPRRADGAARRRGAQAGHGHDRHRRTRQRRAAARRHHRSGQWRHARRAEISAGGVVRAAVARGLRTGEARYFGAVDITLHHICEGGIYDHLGGGFSRYSVDERWLVPHFEKMLYDNAQLLELLAIAYARLGKPLYRQRAQETVGLARARNDDGRGRVFALRSMPIPKARRASSTSGRTTTMIEELGTEDGEFFARHYDVTPDGNFEGHNILNRLKPLAAQRRGRGAARGAARKTFAARATARAARPRRQGAGRLERPDDRGARQCRA